MNIDHYRRAILKRLLTFDASISECLSSHCSCHRNVLDWYAQHLLSVLLSSAHACISLSSKSSHQNWQAGLKDFLSSKESPFSGTKSDVKQVVLLREFYVRSEKKQSPVLSMKLGS